MRHFGYTEAGHNHSNEDTAEIRPHPENPAVLLCALSDGQGGRSGGAAASRIAVETCLEMASSYSAAQLWEATSWYAILSGADEAVCEEADGGLTTLIGFCVSKARVCGASCGDSAAQLLQGGQSLLLTENQRKNPPVGSGAAYPVAFGAEFGPEWTLLAMSDGVWRYLGHETVAEVAARQQGPALISALRQRQWKQNQGQLPDDFSLILLQNEDEAHRQRE